MFGEDCLANLILPLRLLAQEAEPAQPPSIFVSILENPFTPIVGLVFLFYFIFVVPERRRKAEEAKLMSSLKKNDRIVTIGGIHGTIVAAPENSKVVTVKIDESGQTRVKLNRSAIATVLSGKESEDGKNKETVSETKDK